MMNNDLDSNEVLEIVFWFGLNKPVDENDSVFVTRLSLENIFSDFIVFEDTYNRYKNKNSHLKFMNSFYDEECVIVDYENEINVEMKVSDLHQHVMKIEQNNLQIKELEKGSLKKSSEFDIKPLNGVFSDMESDIILTLFQFSKENNLNFQKELLKFFETFKESLSKRGFDYRYLSYAVSSSLEVNNEY